MTRTVAQLALSGQRILLTEDKDFGQLVYAKGRQTIGVILLRVHARARTDIGRALVDLVESRGEELRISFSVIQPGLVRISRLPT
jgi:predicted nuclease of predicted toxin-antitoxin system